MALRMTAYEQTKICSYKDANFTCISMVSEMQALMLSNKGVMVAGPLHVCMCWNYCSCPQAPRFHSHGDIWKVEGWRGRCMSVKDAKQPSGFKQYRNPVTVVMAPNQTASRHCSEFPRWPSVRTGVPACLCSASGTCSSHSIYCTTKDIYGQT